MEEVMVVLLGQKEAAELEGMVVVEVAQMELMRLIMVEVV
jgi:hypothetical protein